MARHASTVKAMNTVHMLVNPAARRGRGGRTANTVEQLLVDRGLDVARIEPDSAEVVANDVAAARNQGMERLIIVGGDGIIHQALPALAQTDVAVGLVPSGTGNDFARALSIPKNTKKAVDAALLDSVAIDLIRSGDRWAASVVTGGWSGDVNERAANIRFPNGQHRYTAATLLELGGLKPTPLTLEIDGEVHQTEMTLFAVGNTAYFGGGMKVCPNALPSDGLLEIAVLAPVSGRQLVPIIPKIFPGRHVNHPKVSVWRGTSVKLSTPVQLWADGEHFGAGNAELVVVPGAIKIAGACIDT